MEKKNSTGSATADYNVIGVRPSSGAASTGCPDASDSIGARSRSDIAAPGDGRIPPRRSPAVADPVLREQIKRWQFAFRAVTYSVRSDSGAGWKTNRNELEFELCHSIEVCARLPRWVANGMCSSALSGLNCSRNAANGNRATGSPAFARPSGMRKPKREEPMAKWRKASPCFRVLRLGPWTYRGSTAKISGGGGCGVAAGE